MDKKREQEIAQMHDAGLGLGAIADELGLSTTAVRNVLQKYGKQTQTPGTKDEDAIVTAYVDGLPISGILYGFGITHGKLYSILARHGIPTRQTALKEGRELMMETAISMYERGAYLWEIREETGVAQPTLHAELHRRGIQLRRNFTGPVDSGESGPAKQKEM